MAFHGAGLFTHSSALSKTMQSIEPSIERYRSPTQTSISVSSRMQAGSKWRPIRIPTISGVCLRHASSRKSILIGISCGTSIGAGTG